MEDTPTPSGRKRWVMHRSEHDVPSPPVMRVYVFGEFALERLVPGTEEGGAAPHYERVSNNVWGGRGPAQALLKFLLCRHRRRAMKDELVEALWPEPEDEERDKHLKSAERACDAAASVLRSVARCAGGESLLTTISSSDGTIYKLPDQGRLWTDADAFEALVDQALRATDVQEALPAWEAAYRLAQRGEFLEDDRYRDWAVARRERLRGKIGECVYALADLYAAGQRSDLARDLLWDAVAASPTDEDALYRLLLLLEQQGRYQATRQVYRRAQEVAEQDGLPLAPRIHALAKRIREQEAMLEVSPMSTTIYTGPVSTRMESITQALTPDDAQSNLLPLLSQALVQGLQEAIHELERVSALHASDFVTRRTVLAHLLGLPSVLSALDSYVINSLTEAMLFLEKDTLDVYEDLLVMGWDSFRRSKAPAIIHRIDGYVDKLATLSRDIPTGKWEQWQSLLCRFSQLATRIAQHTMNEQRALRMAKQAIEAASELDEAELIASAFYRRSRVHLEYSHTATDERQKQRHFALARADVDAALTYAEQVRPPLKGNIYLIAAEIYARLAGHDATLRTQCEAWQDHVATLVYGGTIEDDGTFLKLDRTALHHEKAKTWLQFGHLQDARHELETARETLPPNLLTWQMNMHLTETDLALAERDLERSAASALQAGVLAQVIYSHKGKVEVQQRLAELQQLDPLNATVHELAQVIEREA